MLERIVKTSHLNYYPLIFRSENIHHEKRKHGWVSHHVPFFHERKIFLRNFGQGQNGCGHEVTG